MRRLFGFGTELGVVESRSFHLYRMLFDTSKLGSTRFASEIVETRRLEFETISVGTNVVRSRFEQRLGTFTIGSDRRGQSQKETRTERTVVSDQSGFYKVRVFSFLGNLLEELDQFYLQE